MTYDLIIKETEGTIVFHKQTINAEQYENILKLLKTPVQYFKSQDIRQDLNETQKHKSKT